MGKEYHITLQDAKTHVDNWIQTKGERWEPPLVEPQIGLNPIILTVFLFDKPKRPLGR